MVDLNQTREWKCICGHPREQHHDLNNSCRTCSQQKRHGGCSVFQAVDENQEYAIQLERRLYEMISLFCLNKKEGWRFISTTREVGVYRLQGPVADANHAEELFQKVCTLLAIPMEEDE